MVAFRSPTLTSPSFFEPIVALFELQLVSRSLHERSSILTTPDLDQIKTMRAITIVHAFVSLPGDTDIRLTS